VVADRVEGELVLEPRQRAEAEAEAELATADAE